MSKILFAIIIVVLVIIAYFLFFKKSDSEVEKVDCLTSEMIISFFKQQNIISILHSNKNYIAVAIKDNSSTIICAIYDKDKQKILNQEISTKKFLYKELDKSVIDMFGDKTMIVLN